VKEKLEGEIKQQSQLKWGICNGIEDMEGDGYYKTMHLMTCKDGMIESFEGEVC